MLSYYGVSLFGILFRDKANDATKAVLSDFASIVSGVVSTVTDLLISVLALNLITMQSQEVVFQLDSHVHVVCVLVATMLIIALVINPY